MNLDELLRTLTPPAPEESERNRHEYAALVRRYDTDPDYRQHIDTIAAELGAGTTGEQG